MSPLALPYKTHQECHFKLDSYPYRELWRVREDLLLFTYESPAQRLNETTPQGYTAPPAAVELLCKAGSMATYLWVTGSWLSAHGGGCAESVHIPLLGGSLGQGYCRGRGQDQDLCGYSEKSRDPEGQSPSGGTLCLI